MIAKIVFIVLRLCHFLPDIEILQISLYSYAAPLFESQNALGKRQPCTDLWKSLIAAELYLVKVIVHQRVTEINS